MTASRSIASPVPIDLRATIGAFRSGGSDPSLRVTDGWAWRATRTPDGPVTTLIERRDAGGRRFEVQAWGPGAAWALDRAPALLGVDDDADDFDPPDHLVGELWRRHQGTRFGRSSAIVETLLPTIIEQKVTSIEARRSWSAIARRWGDEAPRPTRRGNSNAPPLRLRPHPDRLATCHYTDFHRLGVERRRAELVIRVARVATSLEALADQPVAAAQVALESIPGIGAWTSSTVLQRSHGDPDVVVVGDYHLPNIVSWNLAGEPRADDDRMLELLAPYTGHRGRVVRLLARSGQRAPAFGPKHRIRSIAAI